MNERLKLILTMGQIYFLSFYIYIYIYIYIYLNCKNFMKKIENGWSQFERNFNHSRNNSNSHNIIIKKTSDHDEDDDPKGGHLHNFW
jgi:hypothetical protein